MDRVFKKISQSTCVLIAERISRDIVRVVETLSAAVPPGTLKISLYALNQLINTPRLLCSTVASIASVDAFFLALESINPQSYLFALDLGYAPPPSIPCKLSMLAQPPLENSPRMWLRSNDEVVSSSGVKLEFSRRHGHAGVTLDGTCVSSCVVRLIGSSSRSN